jgi:hypothetical protein
LCLTLHQGRPRISHTLTASHGISRYLTVAHVVSQDIAAPDLVNRIVTMAPKVSLFVRCIALRAPNGDDVDLIVNVTFDALSEAVLVARAIEHGHVPPGSGCTDGLVRPRCTHTYMNVFAYMHTHACMHTRMHACMYTHIHDIHTHSRTCTYTNTYEYLVVSVTCHLCNHTRSTTAYPICSSHPRSAGTWGVCRRCFGSRCVRERCAAGH